MRKPAQLFVWDCERHANLVALELGNVHEARDSVIEIFGVNANHAIFRVLVC